MGYHSDLFIECDVKPELVNKFKEKIEKYIEDHPSEDGICWELKNMAISDEGDITLEEYNAKWYDMDEYIKFMIGFLTDGTIKLIGEDNERWGYVFENDKVFEIDYIEQKGKRIFVTELTAVMEEATNDTNKS